MPALIDTNVAIHLRDGNAAIIALLAGLDGRPVISIITQIELEGGIAARPSAADRLREGNQRLIGTIRVFPLLPPIVDAYRTILSATGYSRAKVFDRLIAATAIVHGLTLITINGADFRDIPGLALEIRPTPAQ